MMQINLLPWREERREEEKKRFLSLIGVVAVATLIIMIYVHWIYSNWIDAQVQVNNYLKDQTIILDTRIKQIDALQLEKEHLLARVRVIQTLEADRPAVVNLFDQMVRIIPDGLYLTSVVRKDENLTIEGKAESNTRVSTFMRNIEHSTALKDPSLSIIKVDDTTANKQVVSSEALGNFFSLQAKQIESSLPPTGSAQVAPQPVVTK